MDRILPTALVMGLIVGLLVAGYMNIFNVPVMEWAIELEGQAAPPRQTPRRKRTRCPWANSPLSARSGWA